MTEAFLHYIWKNRLFNPNDLKTANGEDVRVLSVGNHNFESGPDFFNAKIKIGDITWVGQLEIHKNSSDWFKHNHHLDSAYKNTILHVVWNSDVEVLDLERNVLPSVELKGRVSKELIHKYNTFSKSKSDLLCESFTSSLNPFLVNKWMERLLIGRLEKKLQHIEAVHSSQNGSWSHTFFIVLAKNLGFKTNALPMELLAKQIDHKILLKNRENIFVLEAILLGVAGFLDQEFRDDYPNELKREFDYQRNKYGLDQLHPSIWKVGRVRPSNFPTLRLVQLAQLVFQFGDLFETLIRDFNLDFERSILNVKASQYWDSHHLLDKSSKKGKKFLGESSMVNIMINTVAPMLFFYGREMAIFRYQELTFKLLKSLPSEKNSVVRNWRENNINIEGTEELTESLRQYGVDIITTGGETADVGDLVRTIIVDSTVVARLDKSEVIDNANIKPGNVIVGLASFGQASYEQEYNGGMGSNGLTSARHDVFSKNVAKKFPETYDPSIDEDLVYSGGMELTSDVPNAPINAGKLVLSPTRTYAPVIAAILKDLRPKIDGMVHCSGGAQTKILHFVGEHRVIKDDLFEIPPLFKMIKEESETEWREMYQVFNMGHRMEIYTDAQTAQEIIEISESFNIPAKIVGRVEESEKRELVIKSEFGEFTY